MEVLVARRAGSLGFDMFRGLLYEKSQRAPLKSLMPDSAAGTKLGIRWGSGAKRRTERAECARVVK